MSDIKDLPKWEPGSLAYLVERYGDTELGELAEIVASKDAEITKLREENERLRKFEAICHCGEKVSTHTIGMGHDPVEMVEQCPYLARLAEAEGKVEKAREAMKSSSSTYSVFDKLRQILK